VEEVPRFLRCDDVPDSVYSARDGRVPEFGRSVATRKAMDEATPQTRDAIQVYLKCCGWTTLTDTAPFPDCDYPDWEPPTSDCETEAYRYIEKNVKPVGLGAIAIAVVEFVSMFATCGLIYTSKDLKPGDDFWGGD